MDQFSVYEAKKQFSLLLQRVKKGAEIVIVKHNQPLAKLVPMETKLSKPRPFGLGKKEFEMADDFDEPLLPLSGKF